jgi:hypothetical protein
MAGLVPAIHVFFLPRRKNVDARHKAGHDDEDRRRERKKTGPEDRSFSSRSN